jgi:hypothetical protein
MMKPSAATGISFHRGYAFILPLCLALVSYACKEPLRLTKAGPLFAAEEKIPPAKALAYVYWPREERGRRSRLWVGPCKGLGGEIYPGGYMALIVEPGPSCFQADIQWDLIPAPGSADALLGKAEWNGEPGHSVFLRLERGRGLLTPSFVLRLIKPEEANPEIRRCRRSIPLSPGESYPGTTGPQGRP